MAVKKFKTAIVDNHLRNMRTRLQQRFGGPTASKMHSDLLSEAPSPEDEPKTFFEVKIADD